MSVWPFPALDEMIEGIEWRTDVLRARSAEQRARLTDIPRRMFSQKYRLTPAEHERGRALLRGQLPGPLYLPEWSEAAVVSVATGQTVVALDTTAAQYVAGGHAALFRDGRAELVEIDTVAPSQLTLVSGPAQDWIGARIAPAFRAFAPAGLMLTHEASTVFPAAIEWRVFEGVDLADDGDAPVYRGDPVLTQCARVGDGGGAESLVRDVETVDNGIAPAFYDDVHTAARQSLSAAWMPRRGAEVFQLRQWFHYLRGRQRAFWLPCWNRGIALQADVDLGDPVLFIASVGFEAGYGGGDLFIRMVDGAVHTLQVLASVDNGVTETLTLASPAPADIAVADIDLACLMFRVRLNVDRVEFAHMAGAGARVVVPCIEVPIS